MVNKIQKLFPRHNTKSKFCWCKPLIEGELDGDLVITHRAIELLYSDLSLIVTTDQAKQVITLLERYDII